MGGIVEGVAGAIGGAALAGAAWSLLDLALPAAAVGAVNGAIAGCRGTYQWRSARGVVAFVLDSTWALVTTAAALVVHAVAAAQRRPGNLVSSLSHRRNRHVYVRGYTLRRGFLLTVGNTVSGAGSSVGGRQGRAIVEDHEDVHVWQARWFGPFFPLLYGLWMAAGAVVASVLWIVVRGRRHPFGRSVEAVAYYSNPFEWWAYSREGRWPPRRALEGLTWRRPLVRPRHPHPSVSRHRSV